MKESPMGARAWDARKIQMETCIATAEREQSDAMDIVRSQRGSNQGSVVGLCTEPRTQKTRRDVAATEIRTFTNMASRQAEHM